MEARGARIRSDREEAGHGLNQFAELVDISPSWLSRIERGLCTRPSPEVLKRIADGLGKPIREITKRREEDSNE
jgi:transcriptional regulator with XRE-family HTH domain